MINQKAITIILSILISLIAMIGFAACGEESGEAEPETAVSETEQTEPLENAGAGSQDRHIDYAYDHYMTFHMWDYTDMGSGASDDDPYFERSWTVAYDPDTKQCTEIEETECYILDEENGGYEYSAVEDRQARLQNEVFADMDFVDVGIANDGIGRSAQVVVRYHDLDDPANRETLAEQGILCMQAAWFTTIDEAVEMISTLHGEIEKGNLLDGDDAAIYAKCVALKRGDITPGTDVVIECDHQTDSEFTIHAYEDLPDHTATIFWWTVSEDGSITDETLGETII